MLSSIFGKRKPSPVEDSSTSPFSIAKPEDGYVMIEPAPSSGGMYPNIGGTGYTYPTRPAPSVPANPAINIPDNFHYMQGVPFSLSREMQMASNKDSFAIEIGDLLAFATKKMNLNSYNYDFSVEKSVLKECS